MQTSVATYLGMTLYHAVFADIDAMLKAKLIGYLSLGTFAQAHFAFKL